MGKLQVFISLIFRCAATLILVESIYLKLSASPISLYVFSSIGWEPVGRIGSSLLEIIAIILLFVPGKVWMGATLATTLMAVAIYFHLSELGIHVQADGGNLFAVALLVAFCALATLYLHRHEIPHLYKRGGRVFSV